MSTLPTLENVSEVENAADDMMDDAAETVEDVVKEAVDIFAGDPTDQRSA